MLVSGIRGRKLSRNQESRGYWFRNKLLQLHIINVVIEVMPGVSILLIEGLMMKGNWGEVKRQRSRQIICAGFRKKNQILSEEHDETGEGTPGLENRLWETKKIQ